jgi:cytochrome P450
MGTIAAHRADGAAETEDGLTLVLDHALVRDGLADPDLEVCFVQVIESMGVTSGPFHDWMARSPLDNEGEAHRRWRAFMNRTFTPSKVERIRPFLAEEADRLAAGLVASADVDLMADFADVLPALGLCELIGVPAEDRDHFTALARTIGYGFRPLELTEHLHEVDAAVEGLQVYAAGLLERRLADPCDDLVSHMATTAEDAGYDIADAAAFLAGLVFAGNDTTRNQIGWMVTVLADRPELWTLIGDGAWDPAAAVEELLRYQSTVAAVPRRAVRDHLVGDVTVTAGSTVLFSLWGADSDPAAYAEPRVVDPDRWTATPHLAFGHGPHHCLGAALARAELQEALRALCATLDPPELDRPLEMSPPIGINGPVRLPFRARARSSS